MILKKSLITMMILSLSSSLFLTHCGGGGNSGSGGQRERWVEYNSAAVKELKLDVNAVTKAFKEAKNPQDFEKKVNEIYTGKEIISVAVENTGKDSQKVTLYVDKDPKDGQMQEKERILAFNRSYNEETKQVSYTRTGYDYNGYPYHHYNVITPLTYMATGMLIGYMMFSGPRYYTPVSRISTIERHRTSYRSTPAYQQRQAQTRKFNESHQRKFASSGSKSSSGSWGSKSKSSGSWGSGSKKASGDSSTYGSKSSGSSWGSSRSRSSSGSRRR